MTRIRAAVHAHSDWSYDGKWPLHRLARALRRMGCHAVLMTEHDVGFSQEKWDDYCAKCRERSDHRMLIVPGMEYSDPNNVVHILVWGVAAFLGEGLATQDLLQQVQSHGGAAVFAHPARRQAWRQFQPSWAPYLNGMEIWNRKTDGVTPGAEAVRLARDNELHQYVGLDFHRARQFFPLSMRIDAEERTENAMIQAIRRGQCTPAAFGINAKRFTHGMLGISSVLAERTRKIALRAVRRHRLAQA